MKTFRFIAFALLILGIGFFPGCGQRVIHSDVKPYSVSEEERKMSEVRPEARPGIRAETISPERAAELERERRLREEELREKALREKALQDEKARQEALAREAALKKAKLESIFFDFDQWSVREDQKAVLTQNAAWLRSNPQTRVRIEGNCDQRGTAEYNLALGQKRADAVKAFLEGLGIPRTRMETISYGFERPLDRGQSEASWAKNRRVDFVPIR